MPVIEDEHGWKWLVLEGDAIYEQVKKLSTKGFRYIVLPREAIREGTVATCRGASYDPLPYFESAKDFDVGSTEREALETVARRYYQLRQILSVGT